MRLSSLATAAAIGGAAALGGGAAAAYGGPFGGQNAHYPHALKSELDVINRKNEPVDIWVAVNTPDPQWKRLGRVAPGKGRKFRVDKGPLPMVADATRFGETPQDGKLDSISFQPEKKFTWKLR